MVAMGIVGGHVRSLRFVCALFAPLASGLEACSSAAPSADSGPQACATSTDCRSGQVCQAASGPGFCGNCVRGANFAVSVGRYCLETGWGTNLGTGGRVGDNCPIGSDGCVVGKACTQLLRCDIGDSVGLYACPPGYQCSFEQCVPLASFGSLACPPGSSYLPTTSACGALVYLEDQSQNGTCVLYAPPCDEDAGAQSCPIVLAPMNQSIGDGYVSGPIQQVCLPDVLTGNGNVCTPLRTCSSSSDCTDGLFSTCYYVDPQSGAPAGACATGFDSGLDVAFGEGG